MRSSSSIAVLLVLVVPLLARSQPKPLIFESPPTQTPLLELYTSEGCSSCPPAEQWLSSLKRSAGLWKRFVPVAFHVDYWDSLGWRDPWGSKANSDRQHSYASLWRRASVYTPGFVLNGKEWRERPLPKEGPLGQEARAGVLKAASADGKHWQVTFAPQTASPGSYQAHSALLESDLVSDVKAGENRGRRLKHDFAVTTLVNSSMNVERGLVWCQVVLNPPRKDQTQHLAVAFWVTRAGRLEPLQSVGGWLP